MNENENKKVETPVSNQEEKTLVKIEKPVEGIESYDVVIEKARKDLFAAYNKSRKTSNTLAVAVLVVAVVSMLLITNNWQDGEPNSVLTVLGWVIAGLALLGLLLYYGLTKNKFPNRTREYIKQITKLMDEHMFENVNFIDLVTNPDEKVQLEDMIGDDVYDSIGNIASRNVVRGKYVNKDMMFGEVAFHKQGATKKDNPLFVGKYVSVKNDISFAGRIIINMKGKEQQVDLPTKIDDLEVQENSEEMIVYAPKDTDYKKVLGHQFLSKIKNLMPSGHLINTNIVIWGGKTGFYLSYDDASMSLPFDKPFMGKDFEQSVENVNDALAANELLGE